MRRVVTVFVAVVMTAMSGMTGAGAQDSATIHVVHGIPDVEVDVYLDGQQALAGVTYTTIADALPVEGGERRIEIYSAGEDPTAADALLSADLALAAGEDVSVVAHLDPDGGPELTIFANDLSPVADGTARVVVRHVAMAPAVDVRAASSPAITDLVGGEEAVIEPVPATTLPIDIVPTGTDDVVYGPADLDLESGMIYVTYAVGSVDDDTLEVVLQRFDPAAAGPADDGSTTTSAAPTAEPTEDEPAIDDQGDADASPVPSAVPAGSAGLADATGAFPLWAAAAIAVAALGLVGSGLLLIRRRS